MIEVLQIVGGIAGIGGLAIGVLLYIYRDIVKKKIFPTLSSSHATILLGSLIFFTFAVAILGIFAGLAETGGAIPFIALVLIILIFVLVVVLIVSRRQRNQATPEEPEPFSSVRSLIHADRLEDADRELSRLAAAHQGRAEFWYWRARVAIAHQNIGVAATFVDKALERDSRYEYGIALQIKVLLLSSKPADRERAMAQAEAGYGISGRLDSWLTSLTSAGMFEPGVRTLTELESACPAPSPDGPPRPTGEMAR